MEVSRHIVKKGLTEAIGADQVDIDAVLISVSCQIRYSC